MKRISLFLPLVILLASCAQVPAVPTVTATFTATPTQLPTAIATPVPPTEIPAMPTEGMPASPFVELANKGESSWAIPRDEVVYTLVTPEQLKAHIKKLESEETRLRSKTEVVSTNPEHRPDSESMNMQGKTYDAIRIRNAVAVQMDNGVIIHALVMEIRTMVDGAPRRSVIVVSEENDWGSFYEIILDGFHSGPALANLNLVLDLDWGDFIKTPASDFLVDKKGGPQSPVRDRIAETEQFYTDSSDPLTIFKMGSLGIYPLN